MGGELILSKNSEGIILSLQNKTWTWTAVSKIFFDGIRTNEDVCSELPKNKK